MQKPIRILFTGDFCPINRIEDLALKKDVKSIFNDFLDVFKSADFSVTDLECPLTMCNEKSRKIGPHQKAHPECIELLSHTNIKLAALANNHIMDYGYRGAMDTLEICNQHNIYTTGIGQNAEQARIPFSIKINEKRFAFINVSDHEFLTCSDGPIQANPINPIDTFNDIKSAKMTCDYVILLIHAGNEFYHLPSPRTQNLYRFFVDAGADAIIAHHTHCFSGFEIYKEKPIFYGLGNFLYDNPRKVNSQWNKGYVVGLTFADKILFDIIPLNQCNKEPGIFHLSYQEDIEFHKILQKYNHIISNENLLKDAFQEYSESVKKQYDAYIEPYLGRIYSAMRIRGYLPNLMGKKKRLLLLNIIRCESHREVLLKLLSKNQ